MKTYPLGFHGISIKIPRISLMIKPNLIIARSLTTTRGILTLALALLSFTTAHAAAPDLTAPGVIAGIDRTETYNLGPTGLRGWIYVGGGNGADGTFTDGSRQILVTVASTPGSTVLAVDDVILGAMAGSSGTVPPFTSDCRKAFGMAIGDAEKTGAGTLRVKRWRAGTTTDVNISMPIMGNYTATAPYTCPKSALILANARIKLVSQLLADPNFLTSNWSGAINGLALLAGVAPSDAYYDTVRTRLQTYARALAAAPPNKSGHYTWEWSYIGLFLSEYYLSTNDAQVVTGLNNYTVALAKIQSRYGTYNHTGSLLKADGSLHGSCPPYGPVNSAGIPANMAIVMGKKALVEASQAIDPEIDPAIQRGADFFAWYANKGSIPYGEHAPWMGNHESNGKDPMCAVLFGLQSGRSVETEYFTRISIAGFNSRESGHTGQGFSYLWGAMGANMGGSLAAAEYLKNVRWHLDLSRRTDGSFAYDGREAYGPGKTADGTYLGTSSYYGMNSTAPYILTFALPLQRLYITGKDANPANALDATKVAHAIASATFKQNSPDFNTTQLIISLSDFDPMVRNYAAKELATRSLSSGELTTLRDMVTGTNVNGRQGACQTLGILQDATALPLITQRLDKNIETDSWVRGIAATAIRSYTPAAASVHRDSMLSAFTANATDPEVIVWDDPVQIANNFLCFALFGGADYGGNNIGTYTVNAPKNLLYPAVKAGLKQPDSYSRFGAAKFVETKLPLVDVNELALDIFEVITTKSQADPMWHFEPQLSGIRTLQKHNAAEGLPMALSMLNVKEGWGWASTNYMPPAMNALKTYGDLARWTRPIINDDISIAETNLAASDFNTVYPLMLDTIASIDDAITSPSGLINLLPLASPQVVVTTGAKAITLTGTSPRTAVTFTNVTLPAHGTLSGIPPNLTYTPTGGYTGPDYFTFQVTDNLTTSVPGTVSIIVGTAGTGLKGDYYDNADFTNLKLTRTDAQVNFDWGTGSPNASIGADTFSVRWSGLLLVPETGTYTFSTLNSDGVKLYVNGVLLIDDFSDHTTHWKDGSSVSLTAGQMVDIRMDYYENTGSAVAKLKWTGPSFASVNGAIIATEWLFDGTGMTITPYAYSQNVTQVQNTAQAITLSGSGGTLTYSVVTPPAHGTLTGTAPNLTYTPVTNYSGADSFTFRVNNGISDSTPATVSIGITAGPPVNFTWLNATSGNLSDTGNWTPATAPTSTGLLNYNLNFTPSGTYTVTHNLSNGFQLNQLNVAGAVTITGTNSLAFTANGYLLPQFNQNSSSAVILDTPLTLAAMTTFGSSSSGTVTIAKLISGTGGLTKDGIGTLQINNIINTYSGGTIINNGIVSIGLQADQALGSGPVTLNPGGTLTLYRINASNPLTLNGGTIISDNGFGNSFNSAVSLNGNTTIKAQWSMTLSGNVSGAGGFTKTGSNSLVLSGTNSFTGANKIIAGTLSCSNSAALGTGPLDISTGGKVALNYTGTRTIASLTLGGTAMPAGTYGSTTSPATNKYDTYFSGTGTVTAGTPNSVPVATAQSVTTAEETAKLITLTATDANGNPLTYAIVTYPAHGVLSGTAPNLTYTPALNYDGADSFTFEANDGTVDSAPATVTITVTAVNDAPFATAQSVTVTEGIAKAITLAGADVEASALTYTIVTQPANGTLSGTPPNVTYTSNASYVGPDSFTFKVNDGTYDSNIATVSITVNTPPLVNAGPDQTISLNATSWSPLELAPQLWLDAEDSSTITLNGSSVSQWNDKTTHSRHATAAGTAQPTAVTAGLNGKRVLTFDGSSDVLNVDLDFLAGVSHSAFIVTKPTVFSNIYGAANGSQGNQSLHVGFNGNGYRMNYWGNDFGPARSGNFVSGAANIMNYVWATGTGKQILANGKSEGTNTDAGNIGTMSGGGRIGRTTGHPFFGGDIAEIIILTGAVDTENRQNMEGYLAHKWGLDGQLSIDHPRKLSPPGGAFAVASLNGIVSDPDGNPLTSTWSLVSGPANVTFGSTTAVNTTATFITAGTYVLRLTADDGYSLVSDDVTIIVNPESPYVAWSGSIGFASDANGDGISNGLAWALGASGPSTNATSLLPTIDNTNDPDYIIFIYRRSDAANTDPNTTITAVYGSNLSSWTTAVHDGTNIIITPTDNFYGTSPGVDKVEVKIKRTLAPSGKLFSRLKVNIGP